VQLGTNSGESSGSCFRAILSTFSNVYFNSISFPYRMSRMCSEIDLLTLRRKVDSLFQESCMIG